MLLQKQLQTETLPSSKSRDTLIDLYQISSELEKLFVDGRTDGHETHIIRLTLLSRPNDVITKTKMIG